MPSKDTFDVPQIHNFVQKYLSQSKVSVDPFSRNKRWATYTNDLNPDTIADSHMDAPLFLDGLISRGVVVDLAIFDPPYSPTQMTVSYGIPATENGMWNGRLYSKVKAALRRLVDSNGVVLSFGWNSAGMGGNDFAIEEIMLVCHGGAHNDTICLAERRSQARLYA